MGFEDAGRESDKHEEDAAQGIGVDEHSRRTGAYDPERNSR